MSRLGECVLLLMCYLTASNYLYCTQNGEPAAGQTMCYFGHEGRDTELGWLSCVSSSYMMAKSAGKQQCENGKPYCLYECVDEGVLVDNCECDVPEDWLPLDPNVPGWCYDPPGNNQQQCMWYRECLNSKRPCNDTENGYAIAYGERFCNLYTDNVKASYFSQQAVNWIDAVRKCLQVALVPLLRPWHSPTCDQIKDLAFDSHMGCYLAPAPGKPGICSLGFRDWQAVFWTIKSSFIDSPGATLKGFVVTGLKCSWEPIQLRLLRLELRFLSNFRRKRAATSVTDTDALSYEIASELAKRHLWDSRTLDWFGYSPHPPGPEPTTDSSVVTDILIIDKLSMGLTQASDAPLINLNNTITDLVTAIRKGTIRELRLATFNLTVLILSIEECDTLNCDQPGADGTDLPNNAARWNGQRLPPLLLSVVTAMLFVTLI